MNYVQYFKLISFITWVWSSFFPLFLSLGKERKRQVLMTWKVIAQFSDMAHEGAVSDRCTGIPVPDQTNGAHSSAPFLPQLDSSRHLCIWIWWVCTSAFRRTAASTVPVHLKCLSFQGNTEFSTETGIFHTSGARWAWCTHRVCCSLCTGCRSSHTPHLRFGTSGSQCYHSSLLISYQGMQEVLGI